MKHILFCFLFLATTTFYSHAQESASKQCSISKTTSLIKARTTVANPAEDDYDMKYVKFNISLTNTVNSINGDVITKATVVAASLSNYVFELNNQLTIDSVLFNGVAKPVSTNGDVRTINLTPSLSQNTTFTVQVFYHGTPSNGTSFFSVGLRTQSSPTWGNSVTYTMSEPYDSKDWWPTKQSLTDKIDSADIWITVPSNLKAGSNGLLKSVSLMPNNKSRYEWHTKYPIDYYLLSASVASYVDYSFYVHFPGTTDSMLFQNYVYDNPQTLPFFKDRIDSVAGMIQYLSGLYGIYPFTDEKYGHCMAPLNGGMEHQTMTTLGNFGTTLIVHELGHQWFGDNVTCGSWKDIWLNEGFAAYTEYLYVDHFRGHSQAFDFMKAKHDNVLSAPDGSVYVDDTTDENRIFSGRLTYDKGSSVIHTLRFVFNDDNLFFTALKNYQNQYKRGTALTGDFKNIAAQTLGQNLDTFFNQWIYGQGYPIYSAAWNQIGNTVIINLDQTTSHTSVSLFATPIELKFSSPQGDTTVRFYNNQSSQTFYFSWNKTALNMSIDPNDWLLNDVGTIVKDPTLLSAAHLEKSNFKVFPNPTKTAWYVTDIKASTSMVLTDISGRIIWKNETNKNITIPAANLTNGLYLLKIYDGNNTQTIKLIKQ